MKNLKNKVFDFITKKLSNETKNQVEPEYLYEDLTPNTNIDEDGKYMEAITWGLNNENVKNIAITGPYGSGKSSLLKTYEKKYRSKFNFLNISLATFQPIEAQKQENILEKSILQQMIYKVKDRNIPFSRFKRIKNIKNSSIIFFVLIFIASATASLYLYKPIYIENIFSRLPLQKSFSSLNFYGVIWTLFLIAISLLFPIIFMKNIYSFFKSSFSFNKMTIANTTIEKNPETTESIFDKYLDEIFYFFEVTKYNVVVFEDLDRFDNLDIFEKLRELNALLNNSDQINRKIVFIYAVKDGIFGYVGSETHTVEDAIDFSKNRTKFFDFIIPVIPIINSSNSLDKLMLKIKMLDVKDRDRINQDFLSDVTIYIDDMRILKNVFNEFIIYKDKLDIIDLDLNRLLAMVIYKNIYPLDFSELQYQKGAAYEALNSKNEIIRKQVKLINIKIESLEAKIQNIEQELLNSIKEIQVNYLYDLGIYGFNSNNYYIRINSTDYTSTRQFELKNFFDELKTAKGIYYYLNGKNGSGSIEQIATVFNTRQNYFEREEYINLKLDGKIDEIKEEIKKLKNQKIEVNSKSLKDLLTEDDINAEEIFSDIILDKKLLIYLLRHGYIDEMYNHYLTYFHPGSLTETDMKFILSVKNYESLESHYKLINIEKIIDRLNVNEFKQKEILNFNLLDFLIWKAKEDKYKDQFNNFIKQLSNETEYSIDFIQRFREKTNRKKDFIAVLCNEWHDIWNYILKVSLFTEEDKNEFLNDILAFANINDIQIINKEGILSDYISENPGTLKMNSISDSKLKDILLGINVKFQSLEDLTNNKEIFDYIIKNNLYEINSDNLGKITNQEEGQLTYSFFKELENPEILEYIEGSINTYVTDVFLSQSIKREVETGLIDLLNHNSLLYSLKLNIISEQHLKINDLTRVNSELWTNLINLNKVKATWFNVLTYYNTEKEINDLINFFNLQEVAFELSKYSLIEIDGPNTDLINMLSEEIINSEELLDNSFEMLSKSLRGYDYMLNDFTNETRVKSMILNGVLSWNIENFNSINNKYSNLIVNFIEENTFDFVKDLNEYLIESEVFIQILRSDRISLKDKRLILESIDSIIFSDQDSKFAEEIIYFILKLQVKLNDTMFKWLLSVDISANKKIKMITYHIDSLQLEDITEVLLNLQYPYKEIAENGKHPQIKCNKVNDEFVRALKRRNYISSYVIQGENIRIYTRRKIF